MLRPFLLVIALAACDDPPSPPPGPDPVFTQELLDSGELEEVVTCRQSHEHELNHVRTFANQKAADLFRRCVLTPDAHCTELFEEGALFVKYEYELPGCNPVDLKGYTANLKLAEDSFDAGHDWQWQRLTPRLKVVEDGAPMMCLLCHIDHCGSPDGHDLRCLPD